MANPDLIEALAFVVDAYKRANPMRTADMHKPTCICLRCAVDDAEAALAKAQVSA